MRTTALMLAAYVALLLWQSMPTTTKSVDLSAPTVDVMQVDMVTNKRLADLVVVDLF